MPDILGKADSFIPIAFVDENKQSYGIPKASGGQVSVSETNSTISDGRKTVTSAGTAETLVASSTPCSKVIIQGLESNTDVVVVGGSGVVAGTTADGAGTRTGLSLTALQDHTIYVNDLVNIYVDSVVSGEGVSYVYFV